MNKSTCRGYTRNELDRQRVEREIEAARDYVAKPDKKPDAKPYKVHEFGWLFDWQLEAQLMEAERNG